MLPSLQKTCLAAALLLHISCNKFVTLPPPPDAVLSTQVFASDSKATAAINGIYSYMMSGAPTFSNWMTTVYAGSSADELLRFNAGSSMAQFETNELEAANEINGRIWETLYRVVYLANEAVAGLEASQTLTPALKNQLLGEALFLRAFGYVYLVNLYGPVPLVLTPDYGINKDMARTPVAEIYAAIQADLDAARGLIGETYPSAGKGRPNTWAVTALAARVALYTGNWQQAAAFSTGVIEHGGYTPLEPVAGVFLANSKEAIWQLVPDPNRLGYIPELLDAGYYPMPAPQFYLRPSVVAAFEAGDQRRNAWIDSTDYNGDRYYYPGKYKDLNFINAEYYMVLRAAELYLVRAEARARLNQAAEALDDLNIIRGRAGLPDLEMPMSQEAVLNAVMRERRSELFAEWGHRWFDLKRTGRADAVLGALKGNSWQATDTLWPIPQAELVANSRLAQNAGY